MRILSTVKKIPGGIMAVPLLLGATLNTVVPGLLNIGTLSSAVFSSKGTATTIALALVCIGSQLNLKQAPEVIRRGGVLLLVKFFAGALLGILTANIFGMKGFWGISSLAIISSVTNCNGGLYMALMGEYGEPVDVAAQSILNISDGPFLTLIVLGTTGFASIPAMDLMAAVGPLLVGVVLGNIDEDIRDFLRPGVLMMIPFFAFCLGAGINLMDAASAGISGILLGVIVIVVSGVPLIFADKFINRRPGYAGAAVASAAGNSVATPAAVALIDQSYSPFVESATAQIAAAVVVTSICVPIITARVAKIYGCARDLESNIDGSTDKNRNRVIEL
ncbi:2-keto-3-deoxygluconate permease (TC 2.A.10.1.1) [Dethiosulfatibacter aminovorans DSM 17477]|uniref:2-keto-3-deoxygluconate permease (TC 2.A.10.1.1) n=1 Tax=Dethiosulfatibacter aminovorans DSM 17477 TaxID=1121476 RepID=A0A1M6AVW0_9FIRM|nr:2-keto-3-deoxygluconate permease [Dethiosulfatibacter aminovorans]SHI40577.1 2-keto-3-deoxygluconate permease (TC 2.A.10.1.1) [Dethiosulfatibacter aminovorans DSM 17477]